MKSAVKLAIITSGTLLIALAMVLTLMDVKNINVAVSQGTIQASAFGKSVDVSEDKTSEQSVATQTTSLQDLNSAQLEKISQQLDSTPQQTEEIQKLKDEVRLLKEQISDQPSPQTTTPSTNFASSLYGQWSFTGSAVGHPVSGEIVFHDDQTYGIRGFLSGSPYDANGRYAFDQNDYVLTLVDSFTGAASVYYVVDVDSSSFSTSNPINYEYYVFTRN